MDSPHIPPQLHILFSFSIADFHLFVADKIISFLPISAWLKILYLGHWF